MNSENNIPTIMVVDDTPANLEVLEEMLQSEGYNTVAFPQATLAIKAAGEEPPDLFLLDIMMPDMDGFELCRQLKADPILNEIPVIFISSMADTRDKLRGFAAGGVDYIVKPFQFEEVQARVAIHLKLRRQRLELEENYNQLRELEALRDSLVHMVVHDLRSPLTVLKLYMNMLQVETAEMLSPIQRKGIEQSLNAAERMELMINSVLDISKLEAEQMPLIIEDCDVLALAHEVVQTLGSLVTCQIISFQPESGELFVHLDRGLIFRVLQNLIANAIKYTAFEGGRIEISINRVDDDICFRISNNGPEIDPEDHDRIFAKFTQAGDRSKQTIYSTGLGLPFCKLAVERHGGKIGIDSNVGEDTSFWFILPKTITEAT